MTVRVLGVAGTRPEVIKLAPLRTEFIRRQNGARFGLCAVSQQRRVLERSLDEWGIVPDFRIGYPRNGDGVSTEVVTHLRRVFRRAAPDWVVVQGDTTTALSAAIAAAEDGRRCAHVEAGLRTGDPNDPYPEEQNRVRIARLASLHLAPTDGARDNLLGEGIDPRRIRVVGNTGIDALARTLDLSDSPPRTNSGRRRTILVTGHRRENHGDGVDRVSIAIECLLNRFPELRAQFVLHPNPGAHEPPVARLSRRRDVRLLAPLDHRQFVEQLANAFVVLTDSGGVQEEAPYLGTPVLITRASTERPEALRLGTACLVGSDVERIVEAVTGLLEDDGRYARMSRIERPFGDGRAAERIYRELLDDRP